MENVLFLPSAFAIIDIWRAASLVMEDCRVFGSGRIGVECRGGKVEATRCTFGRNGSDGVHVMGGQVKECLVRNNGADSLYVGSGGEVTVMGGTIRSNKRHGVLAGGGKVTVAAAEHSEEEGTADRPQTVSSGNGGHDWAAAAGGEGLYEGMQACEGGLLNAD